MILSEWPLPFSIHHANVLNLILSSWKIEYSLNSTIQHSKPRSNKIGTYKVILSGSERMAPSHWASQHVFYSKWQALLKLYIYFNLFIHPQQNCFDGIDLILGRALNLMNAWQLLILASFAKLSLTLFGLFCRALASSMWKFNVFPLLHLSEHIQVKMLQRAGSWCPFSTAGRYSAGNGHAGWTWCLEHHLFAE